MHLTVGGTFQNRKQLTGNHQTRPKHSRGAGWAAPRAEAAIEKQKVHLRHVVASTAIDPYERRHNGAQG